MPDNPELPDAIDQDEEEQDDRDVSSTGDPLEGEEDLQKALYDLYVACCGEDRFPRLVEVKDVSMAEFYWNSSQYRWWSKKDQCWNLPTQAPQWGDLDLEDMPRFEFVTNIYQSKGLGFMGAVSSAPPRTRFFPNDADNEHDLETADARTKEAELIERWNPVQKMLQEESYHAWTGGFICLWTRYVSDTSFGTNKVKSLNLSSVEPEDMLVCPQCGWSSPAELAVPPVPCPQCGTQLTEENIQHESEIPTIEEGEDIDVPKGRQVISVFGALNCKRPQHVDHQSKFHYFAIEEEIHYAVLRAAFEDKADKIKPGLAFGDGDAFERRARLSVAENTKELTQTAAAQANLCTFARIWFRATAFWRIDDEKIRQELLDKFPNGCFVEFAGSVYCRSKQQSMDDAIVTFHAMQGRGQHRQAIGSTMIPVQDRFNTYTNISAETYEYGIPITYRAADTFSSDADDEQRAAPGLEVEVMLGPNQNIQQRIMQVRADAISQDMAKEMMDLFGPVSQELTGVYPALSGAGDGAPDTLGQQSMQRDQAMGRMGIFYVVLKQAHADILTISCRDLENNSDGEVKLPVMGDAGEFESESIDVTALEGDATAYPEGDENFPELWNQQRATMMQMMDSPYGQSLAQDPENAELFSKLTGIPGLKLPGFDARRKQLREINEIVQHFTNPEEAAESGPPMVEVDSDDEHAEESKTCKWWLNSQGGQKIKRENPMAWQAVKAHKAQHDAAIPPPMTPEKPLSTSLTLNSKDLPPEAIAQVLAQWKVKLSPEDFLHQVALEHAKKTPKPAPGQPSPAAPQAPSGPANRVM